MKKPNGFGSVWFQEVRFLNLVSLISVLWFVSQARLVPEKMQEKGRK